MRPWLEGEKGAVKTFRVLKPDGQPFDFTGGTITMMCWKRDQDANQGPTKSLTMAIVDAVTGIVSYTRAADDLTAGEWEIRVRHVVGTTVDLMTQRVTLPVVKP